MTRQDFFATLRHRLDRGACSSSSGVVVSPRLDGTRLYEQARNAILLDRHRQYVFGPIAARDYLDRNAYVDYVLRWCREECLLTGEADELFLRSAASESLLWSRLKPNIDLGHCNSLVILIQGADVAQLGDEAMFDLQSGLRKFCHEWRDPQLAIHFVTFGTWYPGGLEIVFNRNQTSWPFEKEGNLWTLPWLSPLETIQLLSEVRGEWNIKHIHARYLWELTNGEPWTTFRVATMTKGASLTCDVLSAKAILLGESTELRDDIERRLEQCSRSALSMLSQLLERGMIRVSGRLVEAEQLLIMGLARKDETDEAILLMGNWVFESTLRKHSHTFKKLLGSSVYAKKEELLAPVRCLNQEAYRVICEVENQLRNLSIIRLSAKIRGGHPLRVLDSTDVFDRATQTMRNEAKRFRERPGQGAPLVSYLDPEDLIKIVMDLAFDNDPVFGELKTRENSLREFVGIRNAVAHNRVISESSYNVLIEFRAMLFHASQTVV